MHVSLWMDGNQVQVELPADTAHVISQQIDRIHDDRSRSAFLQTILRHFTNSLAELLDPDLKPPTEKQIALAVHISRTKGITIPRDALINRYAMSDFIERYISRSSWPGKRPRAEGAADLMPNDR